MVFSKPSKKTLFLISALFALNFQSLHSAALIDAVFQGDIKLVEEELKQGAPIDEQDHDGYTALMWATTFSKYSPEKMKILELLLQHNPDLDKQGKFGRTALSIAIEDYNLKAVELLFSHNPDLNKQDYRGYTALKIANDNAELSTGKNKEIALKMVDLLSSKMTISEKMAVLYKTTDIPKKTCFLSFEQDDWNGAITDSVYGSLSAKIISIIVPQLFKKLFNRDTFQKLYKDGKITVLASQFTLADSVTPQLIVIIPAPLDELGIKISESEKQKEKPLVDLSFIENKFGFKNLNLLRPKFAATVAEKAAAISADEFKKILENFPQIINTDLSEYPTRFYLAGHGYPGLIASISINLFEYFLSELSEIGTEFIYIMSCYAAGTNLLQIQSALEKIVTKQIAEKEARKQVYQLKLKEYEDLMKQRMTNEPQKYPKVETYLKLYPEPKQTYFPGIDFTIVLGATSDVPVPGDDDVKAMFTQLDKFLQDPVWALEFGQGEKKPEVTISDVISALRIHDARALPSIRFPGKTQFFRSINIGNMEIFTESRVIEEGVKKTRELIEESKSTDKTVADEAKKKLKGPLGIEVRITRDIHYIQVFPLDLIDFTFVIQGRPKFISKLHFGQHFVGKIVANDYRDINQLITQSFADIFSGVGYKSDRCWFIKFVDIPKSKNRVSKLAIHLYSTQWSYLYINEKGEHIYSTDIAPEHRTEKNEYETIIGQWFKVTIPSQETLTEATGGLEVIEQQKAWLEHMKGGTQILKLLEPKFARTPHDLFNMFMAEKFLS